MIIFPVGLEFFLGGCKSLQMVKLYFYFNFLFIISHGKGVILTECQGVDAHFFAAELISAVSASIGREMLFYHLKSRNKACRPAQLEITGCYFFCVPNQIFAWTIPIDLMLLACRGNGLPGYLPAVLGELNLFMEGSHKRQVAGEPCWEYLSWKELIWSLPLVMDCKIPVSLPFFFFCFLCFS